MDIKTKNQIVYKTAWNYLLKIKPDQLTEDEIKEYFKGDNRDFNSLEEVFEQLIKSAQNYHSMPSVIKYHERREVIKDILHDFDLEYISRLDPEELYYRFRQEFNVTSADTKHNSWRKWSKSIVDAAKFMYDFKDVDDFKNFVNQYDYNLHTRKTLPLIIASKINGIGFALACDFLKELGYTNYPKPDVHLIEVFTKACLSSKDPMLVFDAIERMSEDCKEIDPEVTPYKVDKIIWLICSGNFYIHGIKNGRYKNELIDLIHNELNTEEIL